MISSEGLFAKKVGMTQIFDRDGNIVPVTILEAGPCVVLESISSPREKVRLGYEKVKESRINKPRLGYFKKLGVDPVRYIKEFGVRDYEHLTEEAATEETKDDQAEEAQAETQAEAQAEAASAKEEVAKDGAAAKEEAKPEGEEPQPQAEAKPETEAKAETKAEEKAEEPAAEAGPFRAGQEIRANIFRPGDFVNVCGTSIGKGFQGGMKRWNWSGGPGGHGSMHHRRVGSIGSSADPSRTFKGRHMPGQMGNERVTVQNLRVMDVDLENNLILVNGAVPGKRNACLTVTVSTKKKYRSLTEVKAVHAVKRNPMKQSKAKAGKKK